MSKPKAEKPKPNKIRNPKNKPSSKRKAREQQQLLIKKLISFCDEFADFKAYCWFLCDALYCISSYEDAMDPDTADGIRVVTMTLQRQCNQLKAELIRICDFARDMK